MTYEHLADNIIPLYEEYANIFRQKRSTDLFEKVWLDHFLNLMPKQGTILDIGCGSGIPIAKYFLSKGFWVEGVDSSPTMISYCYENFPQQTWHIADMRGLNLNNQFDGLIVWDSFFHLTRDAQRAMFPIFNQHTCPGSVLMFTSGVNNGEAIGEFEGEPLYHASLGQGEYRNLLKDNGFQVEKMVLEDPKCKGRTVWLAKKY